MILTLSSMKEMLAEMRTPSAFSEFWRQALACLLVVACLTGCQSPENGTDQGARGRTIKSRGIYTTLALSKRELDMPGSGYVQKGTFGPDETPAGVIVGFGFVDRQELVTLELAELNTGRVLVSRDYYASYGKAIAQPLPIRLSGDYKLRLLVRGTEYDACQFSVTRRGGPATAPITPSGAATAYAKGSFDVGIESGMNSELLADYDEKLNYTILRAVILKTSKMNADLFAQRVPGKVVIQCRMNSQGAIADPKIIDNSLERISNKDDFVAISELPLSS